jgi:hypothetical protein
MASAIDPTERRSSPAASAGLPANREATTTGHARGAAANRLRIDGAS